MIAGVSAGTPAAAIALAADAAEAGASALMMLPPLGYRGDAREIEAHYRAVAEAGGLPLMAYNNPEASGIDMRADADRRLVRGGRRRSSRSRSARATRGGSRR